jgi:hypothetical protein
VIPSPCILLAGSSKSRRPASATRSAFGRSFWTLFAPDECFSGNAVKLERAQAKLDEIERELNKHPDFQFYLLAKSPKDRTRMKRLLMNIPIFRLWRTLTVSVKRTRGHPAERRP